MRSMINFFENKRVFFVIVAAITTLFILDASYRLTNKFDDEPSAGVFGAIRLFYLNPFNLDFAAGKAAAGGTSHILDNFIKSAVSGTHGMLDFLHWCVYITVFNLLGIPLNEFWFLFGQTLTMAAGLVCLTFLFAELYDNRSAALVFLLIAAQLFISQARNFYIIPPNTLMEGLLLWALYIYAGKGGGLPLKSALYLLLFLNAASGNLVKLPVYLVFIWCASFKYHGLGPPGFIREAVIKKPSNLFFAIPVILALMGHFYIFSRLGSSNLGMFGWISQKFGLGGAVSRFSMFGGALEKMIFRGQYYAWWVVCLLFVFYVIAGKRAGRRAPLYFFPLLYYLYLINVEPNGALLPLVMILSLGVYGIFSLTASVKGERKRILCRVFSAVLALYFFIYLGFFTVYSLAAQVEPPPNYLKAAGFFLREHMRPEDKIVSLLDEKENILNEYYYGKNFFKSPVFGKYIYDEKNLTQPESSSNPVSDSERKSDFAFYVVSAVSYAKNKDYASFVDTEVKRRSLKRAAGISSGGKDYIYIFSTRPIGYQALDIDAACAAFDRKYANIRKLFYNHHVGVASTWGFY